MTAPGSGPGRATWLAAAGVFLAVLLAAGLGYLIGSSGGDDAETATPPTTTAAAAATASTVADTSTVANTSTSTTAADTTTVADTSSTTAGGDEPALITVVAAHPDIADIVDTYERFVTPINEARAADAFVTLGPAITRNNTPAAWASGQETSFLHDVTIVAVSDVAPDTRNVRVTFRSTQDGEFGRLPGETCTLWDITHTLVRSEPDPAPTWLINRSSQNEGSPQPC